MLPLSCDNVKDVMMLDSAHGIIALLFDFIEMLDIKPGQ